MKIVLCNAFSINMIQRDEELILFRKVDVETVKKILKNNDFESAIGHESTANFLSKLLGIKVKVNRVPIMIDDETILIVAQVKQRLPEGKILSEEELRKIPIEFWLVGTANCSQFGGGYYETAITKVL